MKTFPFFEFVKQYSYHLNANTAFEKLTDDSFVSVEYSDDTVIANSTWGQVKNIAFLSDERMVGNYPWRDIKAYIYNTFEPSIEHPTYETEEWFTGFT